MAQQLGQGLQVGLRADVKLAGQRRPGLGQVLADRDQLVVQLRDGHAGPQHILVGRRAGLVARGGDLEEVACQLAIGPKDRLGTLVQVEIVVGPLDAGDDRDLGRRELKEPDLDLPLGRLPAQHA